MERWLAGEALSEPGWKELFSRFFDAFFEKISKEIKRSETHYTQQLYTQQLSEYHFDLILLASALKQTKKLEEFLRKSQRARVQCFDKSYYMRPSLRAEKRPSVLQLSSLSWLRIYQAVDHFKRFSSSHVTPFIPINLRKRIRSRRCQCLLAGLAGLLLFGLGLGSLYRYGELSLLNSTCSTAAEQLARVKVVADRSKTAMKDWKDEEQRLAIWEQIQEHQSGWMSFFQSLQDALSVAGDGWVESLAPVRLQSLQAGAETLQWELTGRFFLGPISSPEEDDLPQQTVNDRSRKKFDQFLGQLKESGVVTDLSDIFLEPAAGATVKFHCRLTVNSKGMW